MNTLNLLWALDIVTKTNLNHNKIVQSTENRPLGLIVQISLFFVVMVAVIGLILYFTDQILKNWSFFKNVKEFMKENYFIILVMFPFFYLVYYYAYYLPYKDEDKSSIWLRGETAELLWTASLTFLGTGTLTGALKWLNNLAFFKKQFSDLIRSKDFSEVLSEKMKELAMSDNYLLQRNDLQDIWTRVTICKYQQKFPSISDDIKERIVNDFYLEKPLAYYYKNFKVQINFSLEGDIIKILEVASFTIIPHSTEEIELNFGTNSIHKDNTDIYTKFFPEHCKMDGQPLLFEDDKDIPEELSDHYVKLFKAKLKGKNKYYIERRIEIAQDIKEDREFSFSTSRIIESLSINLKHDENLKLFFSPIKGNIFLPDNQIRGEHSIGYNNKDLLLPGEKFKIFIFKKG